MVAIKRVFGRVGGVATLVLINVITAWFFNFDPFAAFVVGVPTLFVLHLDFFLRSRRTMTDWVMLALASAILISLQIINDWYVGSPDRPIVNEGLRLESYVLICIGFTTLLASKTTRCRWHRTSRGASPAPSETIDSKPIGSNSSFRISDLILLTAFGAAAFATGRNLIETVDFDIEAVVTIPSLLFALSVIIVQTLRMWSRRSTAAWLAWLPLNLVASGVASMLAMLLVCTPIMLFASTPEPPSSDDPPMWFGLLTIASVGPVIAWPVFVAKRLAGYRLIDPRQAGEFNNPEATDRMRWWGVMVGTTTPFIVTMSIATACVMTPYGRSDESDGIGVLYQCGLPMTYRRQIYQVSFDATKASYVTTNPTTYFSLERLAGNLLVAGLFCFVVFGLTAYWASS